MTEAILMAEKKIMIPEMNPEHVADEIGEFIVNRVVSGKKTGGVIGLSGGVDSTTTAALAKRAFDWYNSDTGGKLELVGYILPSKTNAKEDEIDGKKVAERLGIRYEIHSIEPIIDAMRITNPEAFLNKYDKGNMASRIRGNVLNTKAATENKTLLGTGNKDEDFGIGYYTLFGDGAVHLSPIGGLSKRLVRQMARYLGFSDLADRVPTAGLEPGQTDFGDLGYTYETVEAVSEGITQGLDKKEIYTNSLVQKLAGESISKYQTDFGKVKFTSIAQIVDDIIYRHDKVAVPKAKIISPEIAPITLNYGVK